MLICIVYQVYDIYHKLKNNNNRNLNVYLCSTSHYKLYSGTSAYTKFGKKAFSYAGPQAWNDLPLVNICHETIIIIIIIVYYNKNTDNQRHGKTILLLVVLLLLTTTTKNCYCPRESIASI